MPSKAHPYKSEFSMSEITTLLEHARIEILNLVDDAIKDFAALDPARHSQAPEEMGLLTLWDEFKEQVQNGESIFFEAYEATMRQWIKWHVGELLEGCGPFKLTALWVTVYGIANFLRDDDSSYDRLGGALEYSTYQGVRLRAQAEPIAYRSGFGPDGEMDASEAKVRDEEVKVEQSKEEANPQSSEGQMSLF